MSGLVVNEVRGGSQIQILVEAINGNFFQYMPNVGGQSYLTLVMLRSSRYPVECSRCEEVGHYISIIRKFCFRTTALSLFSLP